MPDQSGECPAAEDEPTQSWMYSRSPRIQQFLDRRGPWARRFYVGGKYLAAFLIIGALTWLLSNYFDSLRPIGGYLGLLAAVVLVLFIAQWWGTEILPVGTRRRPKSRR